MSEDQLANQSPPESEQTPAHAMFRDLGEGDAASIGKPKKTRIATTQITVALVVAIGGGAIYWMRETGMKSGMEFKDQPLSFESQYTPADHARFQDVLSDLEQSDSRVQIAAADAGSNPFFIGIIKEDTNAADAEARAERERLKLIEDQKRADETREREIQDALSRVRLGTILYSSSPKASIDSKVVGVGDPVGDFFIVSQILPQAVILEADGMRHTITPQTHGPGVKR